jgi:hypothetical protein
MIEVSLKVGGLPWLRPEKPVWRSAVAEGAGL